MLFYLQIFDEITATPIVQLVERLLSEREVVGTKGVKNGISSSLADARIKGAVLGRSAFGAGGRGYQRCKNGISSSLADARIKGALLGR